MGYGLAALRLGGQGLLLAANGVGAPDPGGHPSDDGGGTVIREPDRPRLGHGIDTCQRLQERAPSTSLPRRGSGACSSGQNVDVSRLTSWPRPIHQDPTWSIQLRCHQRKVHSQELWRRRSCRIWPNEFGQIRFWPIFVRIWPVVVLTEFGQTEFGQNWRF